MIWFSKAAALCSDKTCKTSIILRIIRVHVRIHQESFVDTPHIIVTHWILDNVEAPQPLVEEAVRRETNHHHLVDTREGERARERERERERERWERVCVCVRERDKPSTSNTGEATTGHIHVPVLTHVQKPYINSLCFHVHVHVACLYNKDYIVHFQKCIRYIIICKACKPHIHVQVHAPTCMSHQQLQSPYMCKYHMHVCTYMYMHVHVQVHVHICIACCMHCWAHLLRGISPFPLAWSFILTYLCTHTWEGKKTVNN